MAAPWLATNKVRLLGKAETGKLRMGAGKLMLLGEFRRMRWFEPLGRVRAVAKLVANMRRIRLTESIVVMDGGRAYGTLGRPHESVILWD